MAFYSAAVADNESSFGLGKTNGSIPGKFSKTEFGFSGERLYRIQPIARDSNVISEKGLNDYYWDASVPIFSMSAFEAQLFVQMGPKFSNTEITSSQCNQMYIAAQTNTESQSTLKGDGELVVEQSQIYQPVNIRV